MPDETPANGDPLDALRREAASGWPAEAEANVEGPRPEIVRRGGTFEAFRYRNYVLFWSGALVSNVGSWMQMAVISLVVYSFRNSSADLGIVNFLGNLPVLFLAIPAGVLADAVNRRLLIIWAQVALLLQALALGVLYGTGQLSSTRPILSLALVSGLGLFAGVMSALTFPAWQSMLPDLVPREVLLNGIALNAAQFQGARLLGPLAAGAVLAVGLGYADVFYINAASFLFVIGALAVVRTNRQTPKRSDRQREGAWKTLTAGVAYAREDRVVGVLILSIAVVTMFGMPYMMLLPAIVDASLVPAAVTGAAREAAIQGRTIWVMAANGLGAMAGALAVASMRKGVRREPIVRFVLLAMALLLVGFALSRTLALTLVISALTGAAFLTSTSLINTSIQSCVPHRLRGRVMSLFVLAFMGLMPISSLVFGWVGQWIGPPNAVIVGAALQMAYVALLFARPSLLRRDSDCGEPA